MVLWLICGLLLFTFDYVCLLCGCGFVVVVLLW